MLKVCIRTCERPAAAVASRALRARVSAASAAPVSAIACATLALAASMRAVRLAYVGSAEVDGLAFLLVAALQCDTSCRRTIVSSSA
jgi:hypothetical protein